MTKSLYLLCSYCIVCVLTTQHLCGATLEVRLVNGKTPFQGRLEVRYNSSEHWGTVCDDQFDKNDAKVVCRMLGFNDTGYATYHPSPSPAGIGDVLLDELDCVGNETNLLQCNASGWGVSDCTHDEDVGVNCQTPVQLIGGSSHNGIVQVKSNDTWKTLCYDGVNENTGKVLCRTLALSAGNAIVMAGAATSEDYHSIHPHCLGHENDISQCPSTALSSCPGNKPMLLNCRTEIRLQGGPHNQSGRVEVFFQNRWGTICDDSFEDSAASVVCRMLGFKSKDAVYKGGAYYGSGTGDVLISELRCNGDESDIADCDSKQWGSHTNCRHSEDVSVECGTEVRLVGGPTPFSGRLEIHQDQQWRTMCDDSFDNRTAKVVCNMLGFPRGNVSVHSGAYYGQGAGAITDYSLDCHGNETDIVNCEHEQRSKHCNHSQDVGINCYSVTPIRLQGGPKPFAGRVEIYSYEQQTWMGVCDDYYGFTLNDAKVLCNMIGKPNNSPTFRRASLLYNYVILGKGIAHIRCKGTEKDITDCVSGQSWNQTSCDNPYYIGINCAPITPIRLVDGTSNMAGRVEIFFNDTWGSVCPYRFDSYAANVICKMVGASESSIAILNKPEAYPTIISSLDCSGGANDISDCKTSTTWNTSNTCSTRQSAGVACGSRVQLTNGTSVRSGRVEVYINGSWRSICASEFDEFAGNVVCRMMNFNVWNVSVLPGNYFGRGSEDVYLNSTNCTGSETDLTLCRSGPWYKAECEDDLVAAVDCKFLDTQMRLTNGDTAYSGRIEVFYNGRWGILCEDGFTENNAKVVCRQLGYNFSTDFTTEVDKYDGNYNGYPLIIQQLNCFGNETDISMCKSAKWDSGNYICTWRSVGVNCLTSIQLVGDTAAMGRIEVKHKNEWISICEDTFVPENIPVICGMLGFNFTRDYKMPENRFLSSNMKNIKIQNLNCKGDEKDIQQCPSDEWGTSNCSATKVAAISCHTPVTLSEGTSRRDGRVQIFREGQWSDVCYRNISVLDSNIGRVICRMLGFSTGKIKIYATHGDNITSNISCDGSEIDVSKCKTTIGNCSEANRLGISCETPTYLKNGRTEYMGGVSVHLYERIGAVNEIHDNNAAKVVCRMLGYNFTDEIEVQSSGQFRTRESCSYINFDRLACKGNESDIMDCKDSFRTFGRSSSSSCYRSGVNCQTPVRFINGREYQYGRVEIKHKASWHPVCSNGFTLENAYVLCRMLGHKHAKNATLLQFEKNVSSSNFMVDVQCNGSEVDISQCQYQWSASCPAGEAVHIDCRSTVRLVDGPTPFIGRIEVLYEGRWGTIGKHSSNSYTWQLICKMLGFNFAGAVLYDRPNVQIITRNRVTNHTINYLQCVGTEEDVTECTSEPWMSQHTYNDNGPLEISCLNPTKLYYGSNSNVGRVLIQYNNTFLSVCGDNFTLSDADVICRKIGVETFQNATIYYNNKFGPANNHVINNLQCLGNETDIQSCMSDQWFSTPSRCNLLNNAVSVNCRPKTPIRLRGSSNYSGVVEINYNGYWGKICYDSFDTKDAYVLCRMLGFKTGVAGYNANSAYDAVIRSLNCQGNEKDVCECPNSENSWYTGTNCDYDRKAIITCSNDWVRLEDGLNDYQGRVQIQYIGLTGVFCDSFFDVSDAAVVCRHFGFREGNATIHPAGHFGRLSSNLVVDDLNCTGHESDIDECASYPWSANNFSCSYYSQGSGVNCRPNTPIRLVNGSNPYSGRVEIEYKGSYGTVCDRDFDVKDAQVVCRMLGYSTMSTTVRQRAFYGQGDGQIKLSNLQCNGDEPDISECRVSYRWGNPYAFCGHQDDVSVQCDTPVRVQGGWTAYSGFVQIYINGSWQTVCYNGFTPNDARTICNLTGLIKDYDRMANATVHKESYYGLRNKQAYIGNLGCSGEENDLFYCAGAKWTTQFVTCNAADNVAINCRPLTSVKLMNGAMDVNLTTNGKHPVSGRVEVYYNNKWGTICDDQFDDSDALVVCKMMGFSVGRVDRETDHRQGNGIIIVDDLECLGTEDDISECKAREWGTHNCGHDEDIAVICNFLENIDPCDPKEHVRLSRLETRYLNTKTSTFKTAYNDFKLPLSWYNVGTNPMPNKSPELDRCGTHFPIYSADELPKPGQEPTSVKATQVGNEDITYDILVKACPNGEYVYRLGPTISDQSGYCFGIGSEEPPPTFTATGVTTFIRKEEFSVSFGCKFTLSSENLLYQVYWSIDGNYQQNFTKQYFNSSRLPELDLTEEDLERFGIGLGINISCAVRAYKTTDGQPGPISERSQPLFAGIIVRTPSITLRKGETKSIELYNTMPLVCDDGFSSICKISLDQMIPDYNTCSNTITFAQKACSKTIDTSTYEQISTIDVTTSETGQYGVNGHFKVNLVYKPYREKRFNVVKFWKRQYKLPDININVLPEADKSWRGTLCTAQNDPHMHTFDGKSYEHHENEGEYILYKHTLFDNVEIQHKIASCVGTNGVAKCNCGVAIRAGRDVYVINVCGRLLDIGYKRCQDESLTVKKNNDFTYTIYLPYGTAVRARIDNQPWMGNEGGRVVDISVLPSVYDNGGNSSGLCGTLNNDKADDFLHRNDSIGILTDSNRTTFINSWKVKQEESLFSANVYKMELKAWSFPSCVCRETEQADVPVTCDRSVTECAPGVTSGQHSCGEVSERRPIRSVDKHSRIPIVMQTDHYASPNHQHSLQKRAVSNTTDARKMCENSFKDLEAFKLCEKVPATHTNLSVESCILDLLLTNSTGWMAISRQSMQDTCLTEIHRNASVREEILNSANKNSSLTNSTMQPGTTISPNELTALIKDIQAIETIAQQLAVIACLNNCSGHGICVNGTCHCEDPFGSADCSIDYKKPPRIVGTLDKGLCDEKNHECSNIYVFGEIFIGTNLTCRLKRFTMKPDRAKELTDVELLTKGTADSLIEAICPIQHFRSRRSGYTESFVHGYHVSVSNDGNNFGNETDVYIYDSTCQTYINKNGEMTFSLENQYCFIEGRCVLNGTERLVSVSQKLVCDTGVSKFNWTTITIEQLTTPRGSNNVCSNCIVKNTETCSNEICFCKHGWTGAHCNVDIDECTERNSCANKLNTVCQNAPGHYECLCSRGFENTSNECKETSVTNPAGVVEETVKSKPNQQAFTIELRIDFNINSSLNLNAAETYKTLENAAKTALAEAYQRKLGIGFVDIVILSLRSGSLIIQHAVITRTDGFVLTAMSTVIAGWSSRSQTLNIFGAHVNVNDVKIDNSNVGANGLNIQNLLLCASHVALRPCSEDETCVVENEAPVCKKKDSSTDKTNLITVISSSVGGFLILVICILVVCLCRSRTNKKKAQKASEEQNVYHDMMSEILHRPGKKILNESRDNTFSDNTGYETMSMSDRSCYTSDDGYTYYFGKK